MNTFGCVAPSPSVSWAIRPFVVYSNVIFRAGLVPSPSAVIDATWSMIFGLVRFVPDCSAPVSQRELRQDPSDRLGDDLHRAGRATDPGPAQETSEAMIEDEIWR
ncbi:hypothetical protein ACWD48_06425 [Streptomyces sp. NPDC002519]